MSTMTESDICQRVLRYSKMLMLVGRGMGIDPFLLGGLICQESGGDTWSTRPEPYFRWVLGRKVEQLPPLRRLLPQWRTPEQDAYMQRISFGLCQVMGAVARELGLSGYLTRLCDPYVGIFYGAKHLARQLKRCNGDIRQALLRYNGGGNREYPDKVLVWADRLKSCAARMETAITPAAGKGSIENGQANHGETQTDA